MSIHEIILYIMAIFMLLGALDRIFGGRLGLGKQFEEGIAAMGALALAMIGILALSPVLAEVLRPVLGPVFRVFGADPAMFAGSILACDMGGAPLAQALAETPEAARLSGILVGSMLGPTIVFTIPVALGILREEDRPYLAQGVLAGVITVPLGVLAGALTAGFPLGMTLRNLIPIALFALLIALGLWKWEQGMIRGFAVFGRGVLIVVTIGLAAAIWEHLTGFALIPGMAPLSEGVAVVGEIAVVLAGAFPLVLVLTKLLRKPLSRLGGLLKINDAAAAGLLASLANSIPMFRRMAEMDRRGKVVNVAFAVSASFALGDHLGFTAGFDAEMLAPMLVGKLTGGVSAVLAALLLARREKK